MKKTTIALLMAYGTLLAQVPAQTAAQENKENENRAAAGLSPVFRVTVTERTTKAISYQHRSGATKIDFQGTTLMPAAHGEAKVESKKGYIEIEVEFRNLQEATKLGGEYLTYVLWAITPEGRTSNLGEILRAGTSGKLNVTTELQTFGLVVTAEPYFAVSRPSDVVVMENVVRPDTKGKIELIDAKYELLQRGQYERLANVLDLKLDRKTPLELYEARNALQIARSSGADRYATDTFQKAESSLKQAEAYQARNAGSKPITVTARQAVQTAEDARAISVKRQEEGTLANERQAADRESLAKSERNAAQLETERISREAAAAQANAQAEAARVKRNNDAQTAAAQAEATRLKQENESRIAAAQIEAGLLKRQSDARSAKIQAEADRLRQENADQRAAALNELDRAATERKRLESEKAELRSQLLLQFNTILQTRDTARGLIVNMSDVLFDFDRAALRPEAREKLAKVAGIISGHQGLRLEVEGHTDKVEGHTDNIGTDEHNQKLSEQRSAAVRDYLIDQGMAGTMVSSKGLGEKHDRWHRMKPPQAGSRIAASRW